MKITADKSLSEGLKALSNLRVLLLMFGIIDMQTALSQDRVGFVIRMMYR